MPFFKTKKKEPKIKRATRPGLNRNEIVPNQEYLSKWDDYQLEHLNADADAGKASDDPILLPIWVGIEDGIIVRNRIKVPQLQSIMDNAGDTGKSKKVAAAVGSYIDYFQERDNSQSSTPASPLDVNIGRETVKLFYLKHGNWTFTDHTQYSVDNVPEGVSEKQMFEVLGTVDNGRGLLVLDHNWTRFDQGMSKKKDKDKWRFATKFNLHVSVFQEQKGTEYRTDIIIDPWGNNNDDLDP